VSVMAFGSIKVSSLNNCPIHGACSFGWEGIFKDMAFSITYSSTLYGRGRNCFLGESVLLLNVLTYLLTLGIKWIHLYGATTELCLCIRRRRCKMVFCPGLN
jgi:hypothetical protein